MPDSSAPQHQKAASSIGMWLALSAIVLSTFIAVLNSSLMNVALVKFVAVFGSDMTTIQWVITGYTLASAVVIPMTGFLSARFGSKKLFLFSVTGFMVGSVLCAFAWSDTALILFRIFQGLAGGFIMPLAMTIVYMIFPREKISTALSLWGIASMAAPALGPTFGGYLLEHYSWRVLFFINLPFGILAVFLGQLLLKETPKSSGLKLDAAGAFFSVLFFGSLLLALSKGTSEGWTSLYIVSLLYIAFFSLLLLIWVELGKDKPMLDIRLFQNGKFAVSVVAGSLVMMGMMGGTFLAPLYLQNVQGLTAMQTGLALMPQSIAMALIMPASGKLFDRFGILPLGLTGLAVMGITTMEMHLLTTDTPNRWFQIIMSIRGLGIGLCLMPLTQVGLNSIPKERIGNASPLSNVCRQVAGSMGIAIYNALMVNRQNVHYQHIADSVTVDSPTAPGVISTLSGYIAQWAVDASTAAGAASSALAGIMQKEALVRSIADTFFISAIPCFVCIPVVFLLAGKPKNAAAPVKERPAAVSGKGAKA